MNSNFADQPTVLIVDPNRVRYDFLERSLEWLRPSYLSCERGEEALRHARQQAIACFLIHTRLPDMSGFDAVELLNQVEPEARHILVADEYRADEERRAYQLRRTKYVALPMDELWLPHLLNQYLANAPSPVKRDAHRILPTIHQL